MNKYKFFRLLYKLHKITKFSPTIISKFKKKLDKPQTMMIHPNYECNFRCKYCYVEENNDCLSYSKLVKTIYEAKKLGVGNVDILGGEPLLYNNFVRLVNQIIRLKMQVTVFTNGSLITPDLLKKLNRKFVTFAIKTDTPENYDYQNSPDMSYDDLIEKIKLLKNHNYKIMSFSVITNKNVKNVDEILKLCDKYGMTPAFERYHPVKDEQINKEFSLNPKDWNSFLTALDDYWSEKGKKDFIKFYGDSMGGLCSALSNNITLMQDGTVKPCPEAHNDLSYGNVNDKSLIDIWKISRKLRQQLMKTPDECGSCLSANQCHGGCKVYTYQKYKTINKRDPLCIGVHNPNYSHCGFGIMRIYDKK